MAQDRFHLHRGSSALRALGALGLAVFLLGARPGAVRALEEPAREAVWRSPLTGAAYRVEPPVAGRPKRLVGADGRSYGSALAVLRDEETRLDTVDRVLAPGLADRPPDSEVEVVLVLDRQPLLRRADAVRRRHVDERASRMARVRSGAAGAVEDLARLREEQRERLLDGLVEEVASIAHEVAEAVERDFGGRVIGGSSALATVTVRLPAGRLRDLAVRLPGVARVLPVDHLEGALYISAPVVGGPGVPGTGINGSGATIAVLDTGIDAGHPGFGSRVVASKTFHSAASSQGDYNDSTTTDDVQGHGTRVAGAAGSGDSTFRGMAPGVKLLNAKTGYRNSSQLVGSVSTDAFSGADWAVDQGATVMNVSLFGSGTANGGSATTLFFDAVAAELGIHVATAAGNTGSGAGTIGLPADGFNVLAVGAFDAAGTVSRSNDSIAWFSSRGPTTDGRVKPDLTVPGVSVTTLSATWEGSASDYFTGTGTSIATPHLSGALALLADGGAVSTPEGARALLLTTAHHASPYPSSPGNDWGYGGADLAAAWGRRASVVEDAFDEDGPTYFLIRTGAIPAGGRVTLCWNRHVTYAGSSAPSTYSVPCDLDLHVYDLASGQLLGSSISAGDTREQVTLSSAVNSALVRVERSGGFPSGVSVEPFAVASESTGASVALDLYPAFSVALDGVPEFVPAGGEFEVRATLTNTGKRGVDGAIAELVTPGGFPIVGGDPIRLSGVVPPGGSSQFDWTVRSPEGPEGVHPFSIRVEPPAYSEEGEGVAASASTTLDATAPEGTVRVVQAPATPSATVTLEFAATDPGPLASGVEAMRIDGGSGTYGPWQPSAPTVESTLSPGEGRKNLRAEFRDRAGNVSAAPSTATTVLDTRPPTCSLEPDRDYLLPVVPVVALVDDFPNGSGLSDYRYAFSEVGAGTAFGPWVPLSGSGPVELPRPEGLDDRRVRVSTEARDRAGNLASAGATYHLVDRLSPSMTLLKSWRGTTSPGGDIDAVTLDYVAGDVLKILVKPKGMAKDSDYGLDLIVLGPTGDPLLSLHGSALEKQRPVTFQSMEPEATGRLWFLVVPFPSGVAYSEGGTYEIKVTRKRAGANRRTKGSALPDPGTGVAEIPISAAEGTVLAGSLQGSFTGPLELVQPNGVVVHPATRAAGRKLTLQGSTLSGGAGTYLVRVPASDPVVYRFSLGLRITGIGEEPQ
jgi:subtilisin family serine protease